MVVVLAVFTYDLIGKKSRNPKRHDHQSITKSDGNHQLCLAMTTKTSPGWPFIGVSMSPLYLFRCSTTSTQNNDTRPTHRKTCDWNASRKQTSKRSFGLSENHGKNVGKSMGSVVSFIWIFEGILKHGFESFLDRPVCAF